MPTTLFENVTLAFTRNMMTESEYGGHNYSFIVNRDTFLAKAREACLSQKTQVLKEEKLNDDKYILKLTNVKSKSEVSYEPVAEMMNDDDVLVQVKSKSGAIETTKKDERPSRGSKANVIVDIFEFVYGKREFICLRAHPERGCTVQVTNLVEYHSGPTYFNKEANESPFNVDEINEAISNGELY